MTDVKQQESLRCLFASVASITVMDWLLEDHRLARIAAEAGDLEDKLFNIRSFFVAGLSLSREEFHNKFMPISGALTNHIYGVLFADAVRWWAAAHPSGSDRNKYLTKPMYKGKFAVLWKHYYVDFRHKQLAHFPGGKESNDIPFLTPTPYGFFLSKQEFNDFRSLLAHSIRLTMFGAEEWVFQLDSIESLLEEAEGITPEMKKAAAEAVTKTLERIDEEMLEFPTLNRFFENDN